MWTLLDLAGAVALLLSGVHMVQTGIQRGFGPDLRRWPGRALGKRLAAFATNLEAAGDMVDRDLMGHAVKRLKRGLPFPEEERAEARQLMARLAATVRAAAAVFMTEDARAARQLVAEKEAFRDLEAAATTSHFARLRRGKGGVDGSALHLDLLRELKRVNGHLVAAAAYPVLEGQGELLASRLRLDS